MLSYAVSLKSGYSLNSPVFVSLNPCFWGPVNGIVKLRKKKEFALISSSIWQSLKASKQLIFSFFLRRLMETKV